VQIKRPVRYYGENKTFLLIAKMRLVMKHLQLLERGKRKSTFGQGNKQHVRMAAGFTTGGNHDRENDDRADTLRALENPFKDAPSALVDFRPRNQ
jgi:hypothetical protein